MTTIAYDGKTLCTDSLVTAGSLAFGSGQKLFRLESGAVLAICGSMHASHDVMLWLDGRASQPSLSPEEEVVALLLEPDGTAWEYGKGLRRFPACVPWAGGTGEVIAMTAMRCGKTAREAVEIACEMDVNSRGPIQEFQR